MVVFGVEQVSEEADVWGGICPDTAERALPSDADNEKYCLLNHADLCP